MVKLICLEGPDGSGKSTLAKALSEALWIDAVHDGGPSTSAEHARERVSSFNSITEGLRDRSTLFSDSVYKRALGLPVMLTPDEVRDGVVEAAARGTLLIYTRPPMDVIVRNMEFLAREKAHKPPEYIEKLKGNIPRIVEEYDRSVVEWACFGLPVVHYDYTKTKVTEFCATIRQRYWEANR